MPDVVEEGKGEVAKYGGDRWGYDLTAPLRFWIGNQAYRIWKCALLELARDDLAEMRWSKQRGRQ